MWTLIIMIATGAYNGGLALDHVTGFKTKEACVAASKAAIQYLPYTSGAMDIDYKIKTVCVTTGAQP